MVPHRPPLPQVGEVARSAGGGAACTSGSCCAPSPGFAGTSPMLRLGEESRLRDGRRLDAATAATLVGQAVCLEIVSRTAWTRAGASSS